MPTVLSADVANKYLTAEERRALPEIEGVLNFPILTEREGELVTVSEGYHEKTRLLVLNPISLPEVSLDLAVRLLRRILRDFSFQTPGDESRAIASLLTPALKFGGFITGPIPADVAEADKSQSGKTYRQKLTAAVYGETLRVVTKKEGMGVGSLEESFSTALVAGRPFIQFDNVRGKFDMQKLESFLTASDYFTARPAYSKEIVINPARYYIFINSNGYHATKDLANRSSIIRIRKREGFSFRTRPDATGNRLDTLAFVKLHYPTFLSSVFQVIREWHERGKPRTDELRHDFRDWVQILDWIVQNIFSAAPIMDGHEEAQKRVSDPDQTFLRALVLAIVDSQQVGMDLRASELAQMCANRNISIPGLPDADVNDAQKSSLVLGRVLGRLFGEKDEVAVDLHILSRELQDAVSASSHKYTEKVYRLALKEGKAMESHEGHGS